MPYAPSLFVSLDATPCPRVEVLFNSFAAGTVTVTVFRLAEGREYRVRGAVNVATAGALSRIDFEVPFGVPVTYRAQMFDAVGMSLGFTDPATVLVDVADTWVHNPLDASGSVRVRFLQGTAKSIQRPTDGAVFYPEGRTVGVLVSGQRRGLVGVNLPVFTDTFADADRLQAMLGGYGRGTVPVLCFRTPPPMRIPRPLFAAVLDAGELDNAVGYGDEGLSFALQGDEVAPPAQALFVPLLTNADVNAFYGSNSVVRVSHATNLSVNRFYVIAGTGTV